MTHPQFGASGRPLLSRRSLLTAAVGVSTLAVGVLAGCTDEPAQQTGPTKRIAQADRSRAPEVSGTLLTDEAYDLTSATAGKVVVLNFWGSWCVPCRTEAPDLEAVYQQSRPKGVEVVGINIRDQLDPAKKFVADLKLTYPSINDPGGRNMLKFTDVPPLLTPATLVIDRQGRIASVTLAQLSRKDLQALVDEVLAETPAEPAPSTPSGGSIPSSGSVG